FSTRPATPELYTLSLHDALPICGSARALVEPVGHTVLVGIQRAAARIHHRAGGCPRAGVLVVGHAVAVGVLAEGTEVEYREAGGDRKSTRLNSSHRTISYAVFCL